MKYNHYMKLIYVFKIGFFGFCIGLKVFNIGMFGFFNASKVDIFGFFNASYVGIFGFYNVSKEGTFGFLTSSKAFSIVTFPCIIVISSVGDAGHIFSRFISTSQSGMVFVSLRFRSFLILSQSFLSDS